jgi:hypothetical protein
MQAFRLDEDTRRPVLTRVGESVGKYVGSSVKVVRLAKKMFRRNMQTMQIHPQIKSNNITCYQRW